MKKAIYFILFLLLMSFAYGVKPVTQVSSINDGGLQIAYPKVESCDIDAPFTFHFHVYNATHFLETNAKTSCTFHLYNQSGKHIIEENLLWDSNEVDFYYKVYPENLTGIGAYTYIVHCNNTEKEAGFISTNMYFTETNQLSVDQNNTPLIIIVIFFLTLLLVCIFYSTYSENTITKITFSLFSTLLFLVNIMFMYIIAQQANIKPITDLLEPIYHLSVLSIRYVLLAVVLYILYAIINMFFSKKDRGTNLDRELGEI